MSKLIDPKTEIAELLDEFKHLLIHKGYGHEIVEEFQNMNHKIAKYMQRLKEWKDNDTVIDFDPICCPNCLYRYSVKIKEIGRS